MVATLYVYAALFLQSQTASWDLREHVVVDERSASSRCRYFVRAVGVFVRCDDRPRVDVQRGAQAVARVRAASCRRPASEGKLDEAISIAERNKKSHIAKVVATGLSEFQSASAASF